jgi:hypothetical protein
MSISWSARTRSPNGSASGTLRPSTITRTTIRHSQSRFSVGGGKISTQIWYWPEVERWARGAGRPSKGGRRRPEEPGATA